jgi:MFS family permease
VAVAITLAAIYAEQVTGFVQQETMALIFVLNIAAAMGAFAFGYWQDRLGHKLALAITLVGWMATCIIAALTTTKGGFWYAAVIAGLCMGSSQSSGRAMAGLFAPPAQLAEFYGLWTFATRLASIIGPLTYGAITWITDGNQRLAIGSTAVLFLVDLVLLLPVNMARGRVAVLASVPARPRGLAEVQKAPARTPGAEPSQRAAATCNAPWSPVLSSVSLPGPSAFWNAGNLSTVRVRRATGFAVSTSTTSGPHSDCKVSRANGQWVQPNTRVSMVGRSASCLRSCSKWCVARSNTA